MAKSCLVMFFWVNRHFKFHHTKSLKIAYKLRLKHWKYNGFWVIPYDDAMCLIEYLEKTTGIDKSDLVARIESMFADFI